MALIRDECELKRNVNGNDSPSILITGERNLDRDPETGIVWIKCFERMAAFNAP